MSEGELDIKVKEIPSNNYGRVIEVKVPVTFYWDVNGDFDGVNFYCEGLDASEMNLLGEITSQFMLLKEVSNG